MPIIPRNNQSAQMQPSNPTPIAGTNDARIPGQSIEAVGKMWTGMGEGVKQEYQRLEEFQRQNQVNEGKDELQNIYKGAGKHAEQTAKPDGSDLDKQFYDYATPKVNQVLGRYADNPLSNMEMQSYTKRLKNDADTSLQIHKVGMLETDNWNKYEQQIDISSDRIRANPTEEMLTAEQMSLNSDLKVKISSGVFDAEKANKLQKVIHEKQVTAYIDGLGNTKQYGKALNALQANQEDPNAFTEVNPDQALRSGFITQSEADAMKSKGEMYKVPALTTGDKVRMTPELSAAFAGMPTEKKARLIDQMRSKLREDSDVKLSDLNASVHGFEKVAMDPNGAYSPGLRRELIGKINDNPLLTTYAKIRLIDQVNTADAVNQQLKAAVVTPRKEFGSLIQKMDARISEGVNEAIKFDPRMKATNEDISVKANRLEAQEKLARALHEMAQQDDKDPVSFNLQNDQQLSMLYKGTKDNTPDGNKATQAFISQSLAKQAYRGVTHPRVLSNAEVANYAQTLKAAPDSGTASQIVDGLQAKYGPYFPRAMQELAGKDDDLKAYGATAFAPPGIRENLVDAIKNKHAIDENLKKGGLWDTQKKAMESSVNDLMKPFRQAISSSVNDSSGEAISGKMQSAIELRVKRELVKNPDTNVADATKLAYQEIVESQYHIAQGPNSTVLVPRELADKRIVESYMSVYSKKENMADLNLAVPKTYSNPDDFYNSLAKQSRWITTPDQTGVRLMQMDLSGKMQPVFDKYGKPVMKSYDEINRRPGKKVNDYDKGFLGRLFGG